MWYDIECEFIVCVGHVIVIEMVNRWEDQEPFVFVYIKCGVIFYAIILFYAILA